MHKQIFKPRYTPVLLLACLFSTGGASAATVHLPGDTVDFYYDDLDTGLAAYGPLTVVGDSIFATPTGFLAQSSNGSPVTDTFTAFGTITVVAKSGYQFDSAIVAQQGDYSVVGAGASVSSTGTLTVADTSNPLSTTETLIMTNSGFGSVGSLIDWSSLGQFDLSTSIWDGVSSINLSLESVLTASTTAGDESALIQAKQTAAAAVSITTSAVPLPASVWLFATGLAGLLGFSKRRLA